LAFAPNYNALPDFVSFSDLLNHALAFMVLFILMQLAYPEYTHKERIVLLLIYAIFIEFVQYFLPTRCASSSDVFADTFGLLIGFLFRKLTKKVNSLIYCITSCKKTN